MIADFVERISKRLPEIGQDLVFSAWGAKERGLSHQPTYRRTQGELVRVEWDAEHAQALTNARFAAIVRWAYAQTRFYRDLYDCHGVEVGRVRGVSDAHMLPIITKQMVRENFARICSTGAPRHRTFRTSGTTGTPLAVRTDLERVAAISAAWDRHRTWAGIERAVAPGIRIGGKPFRDSPDVDRPWRVIAPLKLYYVGSYYLTATNIPRVVNLARRKGVRYIESFPSALMPIADHLARTGQSLPLQAVFTGSETLTPAVRALFEKTFECQVYDLYGQVEKTNILAQCEQGSYHSFDTIGFTELVPSSGSRRIIATSLTNRSFPLIRYDTGDQAGESIECACGRCMPAVDRIDGRVDDLVVTPDGRYVWALDQVVRPAQSIQLAQLIQDEIDHITLRYIAAGRLPQEEEAAIRMEFARRLGETMRLTLVRVDEIPLTSGGKFRYVISKVDKR